MKFFQIHSYIFALLALASSINGAVLQDRGNKARDIHLHHVHKRDIVTINERDDNMPTLTTEQAAKQTSDATLSSSESSSSSTSYSYSIAIPNSVATGEVKGNEVKDPYIEQFSNPKGLVFIVFGSILGAVLLALLSYKVIQDIISWKRAKSDKTDYDHTPGMPFYAMGGGSSGSSVLEKSSASSSMYLLSKHTSMQTLLQEKDGSSDVSQQGHSYRDAVSGNARPIGRRGSMYISPVLEFISRPNATQMDLSHAYGALDPANISGVSTQGSINYSPSLSQSLDVERLNLLQSDRLNTSPDISDYEKTKPGEKRPKSRPPSLYLEELMNQSL